MFCVRNKTSPIHNLVGPHCRLPARISRRGPSPSGSVAYCADICNRFVRVRRTHVRDNGTNHSSVSGAPNILYTILIPRCVLAGIWHLFTSSPAPSVFLDAGKTRGINSILRAVKAFSWLTIVFVKAFVGFAVEVLLFLWYIRDFRGFIYTVYWHKL